MSRLTVHVTETLALTQVLELEGYLIFRVGGAPLTNGTQTGSTIGEPKHLEGQKTQGMPPNIQKQRVTHIVLSHNTLF
jgi:hypothetical protein